MTCIYFYWNFRLGNFFTESQSCVSLSNSKIEFKSKKWLGQGLVQNSMESDSFSEPFLLRPFSLYEKCVSLPFHYLDPSWDYQHRQNRILQRKTARNQAYRTGIFCSLPEDRCITQASGLKTEPIYITTSASSSSLASDWSSCQPKHLLSCSVTLRDEAWKWWSPCWTKIQSNPASLMRADCVINNHVPQKM